MTNNHDVNLRICAWVDLLIENKTYKSRAEFLRDMELGEGKISCALSGKADFTVSDIRKIIMKFPSLNANWILIGRDDMLILEEKSATTNAQHNDLLNRLEKKSEEVGRLKEEIQRLNTLLGIQEENISKVG